MIPSSLKQLTHYIKPTQANARLADLVWFPRIDRDATAKAQSCGGCKKKGKNFKPIIPKQSLVILPKLTGPNEEV